MPLAQSDRALVSGAKGRRFESSRARQFLKIEYFMSQIEVLKTKFQEFLTYLDETLHSPAVLFRAHRRWRNKNFVNEINHEEIVPLVNEDGRMTSRYSFMVTMSCAIAILGLLLSSPAVVIGAMLISPLMGPIMSLGFSLCIVDLRQMRKALIAIVLGFIFSVGIAAFIVLISPITDPTPEILARTKPNLFDLLVAIFSGMAGGYATIRQKGATIVGVAIATALMPPLAVVGYGIATATWPIAQGAFFLFMTNLLAISLSVTLMAKWYGFKSNHHKKSYTIWQTSLVFIVFGMLSIPLGLSLNKIAYQSYVAKTVQLEIEDRFNDTVSRISNFSINFNNKDEIGVECIMITDTYIPSAKEDIQKTLYEEIGLPVVLSLDQIIVARSQQQKILEEKEKISESALTNVAQEKLSLASAQDEITQSIKNEVFFPVKFVQVDTENNRILVYPESSERMDISILRNVENTLRARFPDWSIFVIPPVQALPYVFFDIGDDKLSRVAQEKLMDISWTLRRWNVSEVTVLGYASSVGESQRFNNSSLAYKRAENVKNLLENEDVSATIRAEYKGRYQASEEREYGIRAFQRVEVRLSKQPDISDVIEQ